jgi:hypothetical protein
VWLPNPQRQRKIIFFTDRPSQSPLTSFNHFFNFGVAVPSTSPKVLPSQSAVV